jgi:hypothetical protein
VVESSYVICVIHVKNIIKRVCNVSVLETNFAPRQSQRTKRKRIVTSSATKSKSIPPLSPQSSTSTTLPSFSPDPAYKWLRTWEEFINSLKGEKARMNKECLIRDYLHILLNQLNHKKEENLDGGLSRGWIDQFHNDYKSHKLLRIVEPLDGLVIELDPDKLYQRVNQAQAIVVVIHYSQFVYRSLCAKRQAMGTMQQPLTLSTEQNMNYKLVRNAIMNFLLKTKVVTLLEQHISHLQSYASFSLQRINSGKLERKEWSSSSDTDLTLDQHYINYTKQHQAYRPYAIDIDLVGESKNVNDAILNTLHSAHRPGSDRDLLKHASPVHYRSFYISFFIAADYTPS